MHEGECAGGTERPDRRDRLGLEAQRTFRKTERLDQAHEAGLREPRPEFRQGLVQHRQALRPRRREALVVDRAQDQRLGAASPCIIDERLRLLGAGLRPVIEALQGIDAEDRHARGLGLRPHGFGRRSVDDRRAGEVVADLDGVDAQCPRETEESRQRQAWGHHVVERET